LKAFDLPRQIQIHFLLPTMILAFTQTISKFKLDDVVSQVHTDQEHPVKNTLIAKLLRK